MQTLKCLHTDSQSVSVYRQCLRVRLPEFTFGIGFLSGQDRNILGTYISTVFSCRQSAKALILTVKRPKIFPLTNSPRFPPNKRVPAAK